MCGRYYRRSEKQQIAERFRLGQIDDFPLAPDFNVAPTTFQPVIRQSRDSEERELVLMRWGLIPSFASHLADFKGITTMNARAETVAKSATFRASFERRRCLVPVDGFYEWKKLDERKTPAKQPFAFSMRNREPFALAGLWDAWKEPKKSVQGVDTWLQSFTIITTEANELMSPVHNRMPVILHERDWNRWLDRTPAEQPPIDLLRPFEPDEMQAEACNPLVGNVKNNGPEMLNSA